MTDAADNYQNFRSQWQQEQERRLQVALNAATETAKALKARGITQIEFDYYGSADEGFIENCRWEGTGAVSKEEQQRLEELVFQILPPGWELNSGSQGTMFFDLETGKVSLDHKWLEYVQDDSVSGLQLELDG